MTEKQGDTEMADEGKSAGSYTQLKNANADWAAMLLGFPHGSKGASYYMQLFKS